MSSTARPRQLSWRRAVLAVVLAALTTIGSAGAVLSWWVHNTVLDTDQFMEVVTPVATSSATTQRITDEANARILEALDLEARIGQALDDLSQLLPDELAGLDGLLGGSLGELLGSGLGDLLGGGPLGDVLAPGAADELAPGVADDLEVRVTDAVERAVDTPEFRAELLAAVEASHGDLVVLVRGDGDASDGSDVDPVGDLVVDLEPLMVTAAQQASTDLDGLAGTLAQQVVTNLDLPDDVTRLVLVRGEQLEPHRPTLAVLDRGTWVFVAGAILLALATMLAARRWWGVALAGVAVAAGGMVARLLAEDTAADVVSAVTDPAGRATTADVLEALAVPLDGLVGTVQVGGLVLAGIGLVGALAAALLGRRTARAA